MELQHLSPNALAQTLRGMDPLILRVDLDGQVRDRLSCVNNCLPEDLAHAVSLASVLSPPVRGAWLGVVREALARRESMACLAILDGRGHAMYITPDESAAVATALIALFPTPMCNGMPRRIAGLRNTTLLHHEWGRLECLSRGQLDTLRSITLGLSNEQIAERAYRTKRAIEWHIRFLNQLLGVHGREELGAIGREAGLCCFEDEPWAQILRIRPSRRDSHAADAPHHGSLALGH